MIGRVGPVLLLAITPLLGACDPCFGVYQCESDPRLAVEGELIVHWEGDPAAGVEVELVRVGGVALASDTLRTVTNREGRFRMSAAAAEVGVTEAVVTVRPPGRAEYRVEGLHLSTSRSRGEGEILPRWVIDPFFPYLGEVYSRATGQPLAGASVEFHRKGGVGLFGVRYADEIFWAETDASGRFVILETVYAASAGEVIGELHVQPASGGRWFVIPDVRLESTHTAQHPWRLARWGVGPSLNYVGELHFRAGHEPAVGVEVEFRRVGGIEVSPERLVVTTGAGGRFPILLSPSDEGEVIGDLYLRPPPPYEPEVIRGVRIRTFDSDEGRLLGVWGVGFSFNYVGELWWSDRAERAENVQVEFSRRGGVRVEPETFVTVTDRFGRFPIMPRPLEAGEVVFDLHVRPSASGPPVTIENLRMTTTHADQATLLGVWQIPGP